MRRFLLSALLVGLGGCGHWMSEEPRMAASDPAQTSLDDAVVKVEQSLHELAAIEKAGQQAPKRLVHTHHLTAFSQPVSVNWEGPIETLVKHVAHLAHYHVHVYGKSPSLPIIVSVHKKSVPIGEIITDADLQAGHQADLRVDNAHRSIEIRYLKG